MKRIVMAAMVLAMAGAAHATCYDLRDASGNLISSTPTPPFSLAWPEEGADAKAAKARGERVVIRHGACYAASREGDVSPVMAARTLGAPTASYAPRLGTSGRTSSAYRGGGGSYSGGGSYGGGRTIHTGPRGGQYYINKNGNKTYTSSRSGGGSSGRRGGRRR